MTTKQTHAFTRVHAARAGTRSMTADVLWDLPRVGAPLPSPDGTHVAVPVTTYDVAEDTSASRIWLVPTGGGIGRPITSPERDAKEPAFSPDGRRLAFVSAPRPSGRGEGGADDTPPQLALLPLEGGEAEVVTSLPLGVFDPQWMPDGSGVVFGAWLYEGHLSPEASAKERDRRKDHPVRVHATENRFYRIWDRWLTEGKVPHLFVYDLASGEVRDLMPSSLLHFDWMEPAGSYEISPSGDVIVMSAIAPPGEDDRPRSALYRLAPGDGIPECLTTDHPASAWGARFLPDGESVVYGMNEDEDFYADRTRLMRLNVRTAKRSPVLTGWDRSPAAWRVTPEGGLVFVAEDDARSRLFLLAPNALDDTGTPRPLTEAGTVSGPRPSREGSVYLLGHTLSDPPEIHRVGLDGGEVERVTSFCRPAFEDVKLGEVREMRFPGAERETVQAFLVLPADYVEGERRPLVHLIHGGPHGIFGDTWHWRWHAHTFAAKGWIVATVNFQGSTSWGQDFAERLQGAWGDRPYADVEAASDVLVAEGLVDEERMAVTGGSYGGYLTTWITSQTDRYRCAVNHAGVYDLTIQYASDFTFSRRRSFGGDVFDGRDDFDRYNPLRHAAGVNTPTLVVHGERDYRVPVDQALVCFGLLKAKGVPARLLYFDEENHWILLPSNSKRWYEEVLGWLRRHLGE